MFRQLKQAILVLSVVIIVVGLFLIIPVRIEPARNIIWGTTFTKSYAEYLGLDWRQTYIAILDDLGVKAVRVGIHWDEVEPGQGQFDFADYDWMVDEAEKRVIGVLPVVGYKLPRWPECRAPKWAEAWLPEDRAFWKRWLDVGAGSQRKEFEAAQLNMMKAVVDHFKARSSIRAWQVENEGFIGWFGDCPPITDEFIRSEAEFVRGLDSRPVLMTESGELSSGLKSALVADGVGTSLYRQVWSPFFKRFLTYPFSPSFYAHKAQLLKPWVSRFFISELQLEAWTPAGVLSMPIEEQLQNMNPEKLRATLEYAKATGIEEIYTWGAEWWWYLKLQGYPEFWEAAKAEFK